MKGVEVAGYQERPGTLPGSVLWRSDRAGEGEILPDGCMDLIWVDGSLLVAGPDLTPYLSTSSGQPHVGLRLPPGFLPHLLRHRAADLVNQRAGLDQLDLPADIRRSVSLTRHDEPEVWLERLVARWLSEVPTLDMRRSVAAGRLLEAGVSVAATAAQLAVDVRQLHRSSQAWFGYGPKALARILRLQRALAATHSGTSGADVAAAVGYADQSHLNRDARKITGRSFSELAAPY